MGSRRVGCIVLCVLSLVAIGFEVRALARPVPETDPALVAADTPTLVPASVPTTTSSAVRTSPVTTIPPSSALGPEQVLVPEPVPAGVVDAPSAVSATPLFPIRIPKIDLEAEIFNGVDLDTLSNGPGHWPGSATPGEVGNMVIAGHRVTWSRPFHNLDLLEPGDTIEIGAAKYAVDRVFVVQPEDVWIINPTPTATVTLFACHPKGSAAQRIVVTGRLLPPA